MPLDVGSSLIVAAAAVVAACVPALISILRLGPQLPTKLLLAAIAATSGWMVAAAAIAVTVDDPQRHTGGLAMLGSVAVTGAALLMLAGVERLPGVADSSSARLRQRVDAVLIASALGTGGWIAAGLVFNHATPINLPLTRSVFVTAPPVIAAIGTLAFALVAMARASAPRLAVSFISAGGFLITAGGAGVVVSIGYEHPAQIASASLAIATGIALMGVSAAPSLREQLTGVRSSHNPRWLFAGVVVIAALVLVLVQLSFSEVMHHVGVIAGVFCATTLVLRQWIALSDAHKLAVRLSEDDVHLRELAYTDALTGVSNRRELLRVLEEDARGGPPCVLLAIDLDGFKNVNDLRGHDIGDMVLAEIGRRLRSNLRPGDVAARLGGDEFAVLMWAGLTEATAVAKRLQTTLSEPHETAGGSVYVSASIGVAGCASAHDVPSLLRNADLALRFAKQRGKNRFELYDVAYDEWLRRRTGLEHELRGAVVRDELNLAYQPIVDLESDRIVGVEALLRWEHPRLGTVPPDEFIPIAEDAGMIRELDQWVLHRACRQLSRWLGDGHDIWLSVNISVRELYLFDYVAHIEEVLRAHRVPPDRLVLEITEHAVALDPDELVAQLDGLREIGVKIALDDFGTGYSSLGQLRSLPVDILKIDRSLVSDPGGAPPLVDVVVTLGHRLGLMVIAEGVSQPAELAVAEDAGATLIQGELLGRAMPAERLEAMLPGNVEIRPPRPRAHDMGRLDSGREMRQS